MITVFVEGRSDEVVLSRLLSDLVPEEDIRLVASGGRDAARPLARKQLLVTRNPVALVIDSDTTDSMRVAQQQRDLEDYLRWGAQGVGFAVIQFVPEIEVIFFQGAAVLSRALGRDLDASTVIAGKFAPAAMLKQLMAQAGVDSLASLVARLDESDLAELRTVEPIAALRNFLQHPMLGRAGFATSRTA
jgi:hypothetical protein